MVRSTLLDGVSHGYTGIAEGDFGPRSPGQSAAVAALRAALDGRSLRMVTQVHGARVVSSAEATLEMEADAILCTEPGVIVAVRVADCVPILLAAPGGVAAVHAGWRGTAAGITRAAVLALAEATGAEPGAMRAAVGPAIGPECYEVGPEVVEGVGAVVPGGWAIGARNVDLGAANAAILASLGVRVDRVGGCTRCDAAYWSHRRDGARAGRQVGAIRC